MRIEFEDNESTTISFTEGYIVVSIRQGSPCVSITNYRSETHELVYRNDKDFDDNISGAVYLVAKPKTRR